MPQHDAGANFRFVLSIAQTCQFAFGQHLRLDLAMPSPWGQLGGPGLPRQPFTFCRPTVPRV
jgi:hypothetical protein